MKQSAKISNPTLKFAPFGGWDAPAARPLAPRSVSSGISVEQ